MDMRNLPVAFSVGLELMREMSDGICFYVPHWDPLFSHRNLDHEPDRYLTQIHLTVPGKLNESEQHNAAYLSNTGRLFAKC